jgi:hypothetical protein
VLYLATPSSMRVRDAMSAGLIGCMTTPAQGNVLPDDAWYACDNGKFGKGWPGHDKWIAWLERTVTRYGPDRCLWAVAPDVPFDAAATLVESQPWLAPIRELGIPAAFAAQGGSEEPGMVPWDDLDVLFLAGGVQCRPCGYEGLGRKDSLKSPKAYCPHCDRRIYEWKLSREAADLAADALARGKKVHMGRVSSELRVRHAIAIGCSTKDGTYLRFGADENLPKLLGWYARMPKRQPPHVEFPLPIEEAS